MLHCNKNNPAGQEIGPSQVLPMFVTYILSKVSAYRRYRETLRELSHLSNRELEDLGLSRFQIATVARQAAVA